MFSNFKKTKFRIEKKFIIEENNVANFKAYLATNFFKKTYPDREVNSIYVDTVNLDNLKDNINGVSIRAKHRFRWYEKKLNAVQFEQKNKSHFYVWKHRCLVGSFPDEKDLIKNINNKNIYKNIIFLNKFNFIPILKTSYRRSYWVSKNNKIRATLDRKLIAFPMQDSKNSIEKKVHLYENIIEFKMPVENEEYFRNLVNYSNLNLRVQKFSKYLRSFIELDYQGLLLKI